MEKRMAMWQKDLAGQTELGGTSKGEQCRLLVFKLPLIRMVLHLQVYF